MRNFSIGLLVGVVSALGIWYALKAPSTAPLEQAAAPQSSTTASGMPSGYEPTTSPQVTPPTTPPPAY